MAEAEGSSRADLLLHPVRTRIVVEFCGHQRSVRELAEALPDIAQTTLYRQVGILADGGVLEVVDHRDTTGPAERVYRVAEGAGRVRPEEVDGLQPDEHVRYFSIYAASLVDTFAGYMASGNAVPSLDGLGYHRMVAYLSDEERASFAARFEQLVGELFALRPTPDRRRYHLASVVIPEPRSRT